MKRSIPSNPETWLDEFADAFFDTLETIPFAAGMGDEIEVGELFHVAPIVR